MKCPCCSSSLVKVLGSRHTDKDSVTRQRTCTTCNYRWSTVEIIVPNEVCYYKPDLRSGNYHWHILPLALKRLRSLLPQ